MIHGTFEKAVRQAEMDLIHYGKPVHSKFWQGTDISKQPAAEMVEVLNYSFQVALGSITGLPALAAQIKPNLPWADEHFEQERVGGQPLNPGETWKTWPWANSADKHRKEGEQFNHTYAERFWPTRAGYPRSDPQGRIHTGSADINPLAPDMQGIRYRYADLNDVVNALLKDPMTRQAYIPIWFPEDGSHMDRKPCTLGYHLIMRGYHLHMVYYIRSCDISRHFRDDIYLAVRLQMWVLKELKELDPATWEGVKLGMFTMHITSLHCFVNDYRKLQNGLESI